jgi:hypothetical protein
MNKQQKDTLQTILPYAILGIGGYFLISKITDQVGDTASVFAEDLGLKSTKQEAATKQKKEEAKEEFKQLPTKGVYDPFNSGYQATALAHAKSKGYKSIFSVSSATAMNYAKKLDIIMDNALRKVLSYQFNSDILGVFMNCRSKYDVAEVSKQYLKLTGRSLYSSLNDFLNDDGKYLLMEYIKKLGDYFHVDTKPKYILYNL